MDNNLGLNHLLCEIASILGIQYVPSDLKKFKNQLTREIGKRLESNSICFLVKNAFEFIHSEEFKTFYDILTNIYQQNDDLENHKCIFLFVENTTQHYKPNKEDVVIFSCNHEIHLIIDKDEQATEPYLVDLDITTKMTKDCLRSWALDTGRYNEIKNDINVILQECDNGDPEKMIFKMAEFIGIQNFKKICQKQGINYNHG